MKVITNTAISLDGRISTVKNEHVAIGSPEDMRYMSVLRNRCDAILVGGNTFRNWPIPLLPNPQALAEPLKDKLIWNIVVSRKMDFLISERLLKETRVNYLFLTNHQAPQDFPFEVRVCSEEITPAWMVEQIKGLGVQNLLLEGGGDLIFQFLKSDLIDEMYVTVSPKLIGGQGAPSLVDGEGFSVSEIRGLKLLDHRVVGDDVFLHYAVKPLN